MDLDGCSANITGSAAFIAGERIEGTTKSGRSRVVSIDGETVEILKEHRRQQRADRLAVGDAWKRGGRDGYVFLSAWGQPIHPDTASSLITNLIKKYNRSNSADPLPHARLHDLRHIHATTLLLAQGTPLHVVSEILGHASITVTKDVYGHLLEGDKRAAATTMSQALLGKPGDPVAPTDSKKPSSMIGRGL